MILYHGSNTDIETINLEKCFPYKDFGKGFYLTDINRQLFFASDSAIELLRKL